MLTDTLIRNLTPRDKPYKVTDSDRLYLIVQTNGSKLWRFNYSFGGKQKTLSLGVYPVVSLRQARIKRDELRVKLHHEIDPASERKSKKIALGGINSFENIAREWHQRNAPLWTKKHALQNIRRLELYIFKEIGKLPIDKITPTDVLHALRKIEDMKHICVAHRVKSIVSRVFRYGVAIGKCDRDVTFDLRGALIPNKSKPFPTLSEPEQIGQLMRDIDHYNGELVTIAALKLHLYVFLRNSELRTAEWSQIDLDRAVWRVPDYKMKMKEPHIVPLPRQAVALFQRLQDFTGFDKYVFSSGKNRKPISENTINKALKLMGYVEGKKGRIVSHSFRKIASTQLNEHGFNFDHIERQLAHQAKDKIRNAYNYAQYLLPRKAMMQWYADYLDCLKSQNGEIPPYPYQKQNDE